MNCKIVFPNLHITVRSNWHQFNNSNMFRRKFSQSAFLTDHCQIINLLIKVNISFVYSIRNNQQMQLYAVNFIPLLSSLYIVLSGSHIECIALVNKFSECKQSFFFNIYCSVHHNILLEITNRCNCTQ